MKYIPTPREVKKANYETKCLYCGTTFLANKSTARFCSSLCRVKYYNEHGKSNIAQSTIEKEKTQEKSDKTQILTLDDKCISKELIKGTKISRQYKGRGIPELVKKFNFGDAKKQTHSNDYFTAKFWVDKDNIKHFVISKK